MRLVDHRRSYLLLDLTVLLAVLQIDFVGLRGLLLVVVELV